MQLQDRSACSVVRGNAGKTEQRQKYQLCYQRYPGGGRKAAKKADQQDTTSKQRAPKVFFHLLERGASAVEVEAVGVRHDLVLEPVEDQRGAGGGRHFFLSNFCKIEMFHGTTTNEGTDNSDEHTAMSITIMLTYGAMGQTTDNAQKHW